MARLPSNVNPGATGAIRDTETDGDWLIEYDDFGDCRATNARRGLRTRLKASKESALADMHSGRLQKCVNGAWIDQIR